MNFEELLLQARAGDEHAVTRKAPNIMSGPFLLA